MWMLDFIYTFKKRKFSTQLINSLQSSSCFCNFKVARLCEPTCAHSILNAKLRQSRAPPLARARSRRKATEKWPVLSGFVVTATLAGGPTVNL
jgi:hypothetical protein